MRPGVTTVGCTDEQGTVLAACSYAPYEYASLELLYRHPNAPRGLGKVVLRSTLVDIAARGCEGVSVMVREPNLEVLQLCSAVGFTAVEHCRGEPWSLYLRGEDGIAEGVARLDQIIAETL